MKLKVTVNLERSSEIITKLISLMMNLFLNPPVKKYWRTFIEPLRRKVPLSTYWKNFPGASTSSQAEVNIKISDKVIALWKGQNSEKPSIEITIEDTDLHEFGKFLSSKLSFYHPLIPEPKTAHVTEYKKKLILMARLVLNSLIATANEQVQQHEKFLVEFDKNYIRLIQLQQQTIISMVKDYRA